MQINISLKQDKEKKDNRLFSHIDNVQKMNNKGMASLGKEMERINTLIKSDAKDKKIDSLSKKLSMLSAKVSSLPKTAQQVTLKNLIQKNNSNVISMIKKHKPKPIIRTVIKRETVHAAPKIVKQRVVEKLSLPMITVINKGSGVIPYVA